VRDVEIMGELELLDFEMSLLGGMSNSTSAVSGW
jgi:hypothetical protein